VLLSDDNTTFNGRPVAVNQSASTSSQLIYTEHEHGLLRCIAFGGSPPPDIDVYVGQKNITSSLTLSRSQTISRERGLRLMYYTTELSTDRLQLTADENGALLRCVVTVRGSSSDNVTALITVHCMSQHPASPSPHLLNISLLLLLLLQQQTCSQSLLITIALFHTRLKTSYPKCFALYSVRLKITRQLRCDFCVMSVFNNQKFYSVTLLTILHKSSDLYCADLSFLEMALKSLLSTFAIQIQIHLFKQKSGHTRLKRH